VLDHVQIVGYEEIYQAELRLQLLQLVEDLGLDGHIESQKGLIRNSRKLG
jgi:hypothetical protein